MVRLLVNQLKNIKIEKFMIVNFKITMPIKFAILIISLFMFFLNSCSNEIKCSKSSKKGFFDCKCEANPNVKITLNKNKVKLISLKKNNIVINYCVDDNQSNFEWISFENKQRSLINAIYYKKNNISFIRRFNALKSEWFESYFEKNKYSFLVYYNIPYHKNITPMYVYSRNLNGKLLPNYFFYEFNKHDKVYNVLTDKKTLTKNLDSLNMFFMETQLKDTKFNLSSDSLFHLVFEKNTLFFSKTLKINYHDFSQLAGELFLYYKNSYKTIFLFFDGDLKYRLRVFEKECAYYNKIFKSSKIKDYKFVLKDVSSLGLNFSNNKIHISNDFTFRSAPPETTASELSK
jgi:hypothetical protein